jgi:hypothetical protein
MPFNTHASCMMQDGTALVPFNSEIDGRVIVAADVCALTAHQSPSSHNSFLNILP